MTTRAPLNFKAWIAEHRDLLKPPVGNAMVWTNTELQVMVVGGPNSRTDYHIDPGEEFFYQVEGDITLRIIEDGRPRDIPIREGEIFLLPALVPHSPQRPANTVGLVLERRRRPGEMDHFRWYCPSCHGVVHDAAFAVEDLGTQVKQVIETFNADRSLRTCRACGTVMPPPPAAGQAKSG
jgi:3-hydroxyanthranilate 3,4-dioxygenase